MLHKASYSMEVSILSSLSKDTFVLEMRNISWYECFSQVLSLAFPSIVGYVADMLLETINLFFIGRLKDYRYLAACGLGNCWLNMTSFSFVLGLASALETFCSQAFGRGDLVLCGAHHNRARVIIFLCTLPCALVQWYTGSILSAFGLDAELTEYTGQYVRNLVPGFIIFVQFEITRRFVISQNLFALPTYVICLTTCLHMVWSYLFIIVLDCGFMGACYATNITWVLDFGLLTGYIQYTGCCEESWFLPGREAMKGWGSFFKIGIPSAAMLIVEWWGTELMAVEAAYLDPIQMAANVSMMNLMAIVFMIPSGISTTACILVGTAIGAKNSYNAKLYSISCLCVDLGVLMTVGLLLILLDDRVAGFFTDNDDVRDCIRKIVPMLAGVEVLDSIQCVCSGLVKGMGKQRIASITSIASYYVVMQPICLLLAFKCGLKIYGLWIGNALGQLTSTLFYAGIILSQNWQKIVEDAQLRLKQEMKDLSSVLEGKDSSSSSAELFMSI